MLNYFQSSLTDSLGANFDDSTMPWTTEYDWIEVHEYNPMTGDFYFMWKDEFMGH